MERNAFTRGIFRFQKDAKWELLVKRLSDLFFSFTGRGLYTQGSHISFYDFITTFFFGMRYPS